MDRLSQLPPNVFTNIVKYVDYNQRKNKQSLIEFLIVYYKRWQGRIIRNEILYNLITITELIALNKMKYNTYYSKKIYKRKTIDDVRKIKLTNYIMKDNNDVEKLFTFNFNNVKVEYLSNINELTILLNGLYNYKRTAFIQPLSVIPEFLFELTNLSKLTIEYNYIRTIPNELFNLINLEYLNLTGNRLDEIGEDIYKLTKLKTLILHIRHSKLESLPLTFSKLQSVEYLQLKMYNLSIIPKEIFSLVNLKTLNMSCNDIDLIPDEIGDLINLNTLIFDSNLITKISPNISKLDKLTHLYLENNLLDNMKFLSTTKKFVELMIYRNHIKPDEYHQYNYCINKREMIPLDFYPQYKNSQINFNHNEYFRENGRYKKLNKYHIFDDKNYDFDDYEFDEDDDVDFYDEDDEDDVDEIDE